MPVSIVGAALPLLERHCYASSGRGIWKALDLMCLLDGADLIAPLAQELDDANRYMPIEDADTLRGALADLPRRCLPAVGLGTFGLHTPTKWVQ